MRKYRYLTRIDFYTLLRSKGCLFRTVASPGKTERREGEFMKKLAFLVLAIGLCLLTAPVMASEEDEGGANSLYQGDNIWIAISPMESHPMYVDRPAAIIPTIPGYPIRVAVYSNPYKYLTTDEDNNPIWGEIYDESAPDFDVTDLGDYSADRITLRVPADPSADILMPASDGAVYKKVHTESGYKWQYVFYVRDMDTLTANIDRLFFCVEDENGNIEFRGSGAVMVTATSKSGGGGSPPGGKGSGSGSESGQHDPGDGGSGGSGKK